MMYMNILFFFLLFFGQNLLSENIFVQEPDTQQENVIEKANVKNLANGSQIDSGDLLISFSYSKTNLVTIVNQIAQYKSYNVIFPVGANAINALVSFSLNGPVSVDKAWDMLVSLLDVAGYTVIPRGKTISIIKNNKDIARESYATLIGVEPSAIPDIHEMIRYVYYLSNIRFTEKVGESELTTLYKAMMPAEAIFATDPISNAIIMVGKANDIKGFMDIVVQLDQIKFHESFEIVTLRYTNATTIAQLINEHLIKQDSTNRYRIDAKRPPEQAYISPFTKIIQIPQANKLILLGTRQSIDRIRDFIQDVLDIDLNQQDNRKNSVLHVYELQYRDAESLAEVLKRVVESS